MPFQNPSPEQIKDLLLRIKTIAVVGLSPLPNRPSYQVAQALQGFGYRIIPVRPMAKEVLGEPAHASLDEVPVPIDLVDAFRCIGNGLRSGAHAVLCPPCRCLYR